jgi:hypothetical protein
MPVTGCRSTRFKTLKTFIGALREAPEILGYRDESRVNRRRLGRQVRPHEKDGMTSSAPSLTWTWVTARVLRQTVGEAPPFAVHGYTFKVSSFSPKF